MGSEMCIRDRAEIMWADGSVKTLDINKLIEKLPTEHAE